MMWTFLFGLFLAVLPVSLSNQVNENGKLGTFFEYKIDTDLISSDASPAIKFQAAQKGSPDLPKWLKLEQNDATEPAFIYGTPDNETVTSVIIDIIGWNKKDYTTDKIKLAINIDTSEEPPRYQADFKITNRNIDKFLQGNHPQKFLERMEDNVWKDVSLTKVDGAPDRGGRYPLPNEGKEGVYVRVGSPGEYQVLEGAVKCKGIQPDPFLSETPKYKIDWCDLTLIDLEKVQPSEKKDTTSNVTTGAFTALSFEPVEFDESRDDLLVPFILVVIIPIIIGIILFIFLSCVMFGGREGVAERDSRTPHEQILHHHSIRRATFRLREMSKPQPMTETDAGHTPPPSHSHGPPPSESGSEAGESDRSAPPPYRMPPTIPASSPDNTRQQPPPFMRSGSMS